MNSRPDEFDCVRPHSNLVTFEIEGDVYGLNFCKADEAREFVEKIFEITRSKGWFYVRLEKKSLRQRETAQQDREHSKACCPTSTHGTT